jgi:hypothetical protein
MSLAQEINECDSVRMKYEIISMTEIRNYYAFDTIRNTDTIWNANRYDKYGRLIEEKYQIGTHVLHKYFYDYDNKLIQEVRLTSNTSKDVFTRPEIYTDTMTKIDYHYDNNKVTSADKVDNWGSFVGRMMYSYNSSDSLVSILDIDTANNINDFVIHKLKPNGNLDYSVYNHNHMSNEITYKYDNGSIVKKTVNDGKYKSIVLYNLETNKISEVQRYSDDELISNIIYEYNKYGLTKQITYILIEENIRIKVYEYNYIYNQK